MTPDTRPFPAGLALILALPLVTLALNGCASRREATRLQDQACVQGLTGSRDRDWFAGNWTPIAGIDSGSLGGGTVVRLGDPLKFPPENADQAFSLAVSLPLQPPAQGMRLMLYTSTHEAREFSVQPDVSAGHLLHLSTSLPHSRDGFPVPYFDLPRQADHWKVAVVAPCGSGTLDLTLNSGRLSGDQGRLSWNPDAWTLKLRQTWTLPPERAAQDSSGTTSRVLSGPWPNLKDEQTPDGAGTRWAVMAVSENAAQRRLAASQATVLCGPSSSPAQTEERRTVQRQLKAAAIAQGQALDPEVLRALNCAVQDDPDTRAKRTADAADLNARREEANRAYQAGVTRDAARLRDFFYTQGLSDTDPVAWVDAAQRFSTPTTPDTTGIVLHSPWHDRFRDAAVRLGHSPLALNAINAQGRCVDYGMTTPGLVDAAHCQALIQAQRALNRGTPGEGVSLPQGK